MNKKIKQIIACLRKDARMSLTKMSRKINVPVSTIFDRLKADEKELIIKHTSLIDFGKLGYNTRANISIKAHCEDKEELKEYLLKHQQINSLYRVNNGFDYMLDAIFIQIKDMEDFIENLEKRFKIVEVKSYYIIDELKREEFMSEPDLILD